MPPRRQSIWDRLEKNSVTDPVTGCKIWTGLRDKDGYGKITFHGQSYRVHRLVAELVRNLDPKSDLIVCHKDDICRSKACWNPDHTFDGTYSQNNTKDYCDRGHFNWYVNPKTKVRYCKTCIANSPSARAARPNRQGHA